MDFNKPDVHVFSPSTVAMCFCGAAGMAACGYHARSTTTSCYDLPPGRVAVGSEDAEKQAHDVNKIRGISDHAARAGLFC